MDLIVERVIHLSAERARQLDQLAVTRGVNLDALVVDALEWLLCENTTPDEDCEDTELLRRLEAETGPARARTVPPLDPTRFVETHAVPIPPEWIRIRGEGD